MKINQFLSATALVGLSVVLPGMASAQTATSGNGRASTQTTASNDPAATSSQADPQGQVTAGNDLNTSPAAQSSGGSDVVVTGSRISSPNATSSSPITTVTATQLLSTSRVSLGDTLNTLPQLQATFSQANSTRFLGTAGLNLADLRGLGPQRTLVLVNGRRHVGADILNNGVSTDINTIPSDLIESVDVVTGGESSVYGSDAIAGVINFKLRDHYQGLEARAQSGISQSGDAGAYFTSILAGKNFADNRGNIAIDLEYARQNLLYASERASYRTVSGFVTTDTDPAGIATGQTLPNYDGIPDAVFFHNIRSATISGGGLVSFASPSGGCGTDATGKRFSCNYLFQPDGSLVAQTGTRVGIGTNTSSPSGSSFLGGNGYNTRSGQLVQLQPALDRYSANLVGHFDISEALVPFIEATYTRTDTYGQGSSGPAFITGATTTSFTDSPTTVYERPRLDNPYLSDQARATITNALIAGGTDPVTITGATRFSLRKNLEDLGVRSEQARRQTYRIVGGVRGQFNGDWHYEVSGNYGEFTEDTRVLGNLNVQRFLLAMDAQRSPGGQIVCGSQISAARAGTDFAGNAANLAQDIAACVPINPFGRGSISDAAKRYLLQDTVSHGKITQLDALAFINGNTGGFFNLPGGPVSFAVGGEYRRETNKFTPDPLVENGYTFYNALQAFDPPAFEVKEGYGEVQAPVFRDKWFAHELTLTGAARVSDYNSNAGTNATYDFGGTWSPIQDITFRAHYSRAVRAPNLSELYQAQGQNFASINDPCSANFIGTGTQYRAKNCAAAGIPTNYNFLYQQSLTILSGGNPNLNVEKSDSYTYGAILKPRFTPGLQLSVDYYNIKVNDVITTPSAQQILNSCYDGPNLSSQFCSLFQRTAAGQTGPHGEQAYQIIEGSLQQTLLNYANLRTRGIDVELSYSHSFGAFKLSSLLAYTHQLENDAFTDPTQPNFGTNYLQTVGTPKDKVYWNINAALGIFEFNTTLNYLGKMSVGAIEDTTSYQGRPPQNADDYSIPYYPDVIYASARLGLNIKGGSQFYVGVDNLTDRLPPLGSTGIGGGTGVYDNVGRRFYAGFKAKF
jgi:outer membrane receptor protein involved in Fe transport